MVAVGQRIDLGAAGEFTATTCLGEGGQGEVWRLDAADAARGSVALKWYFPHSSTPEQREAIRRLIDRGRPGESFLWPSLLVDGDDGSFGYVMPLRPSQFRSIGDLLRGRFETPPSLLLRVCVELAHAFLGVHSEGLCYRDISFGNVFVEPVTGRVLVCDNDNVGVDGASYTAVLGTRRFMAPEVIRGDVYPSAQTDLHSLAVLVFYLLVMHHPLLGARERLWRGREGETRLLGTEPLFIFDPDDASNRPEPVTQPAPLARWELLPEAVRVLFVDAFTVGLRDPDRRTRESVWRAALAKARDDIIVCHFCHEENFTDNGSMDACRWCRRPARPPVHLVSRAISLVLNDGTEIVRHHVARDYDLGTVLGVVMFDQERGRWGIRNVGEQAWIVRAPGRTEQRLDPGRTVALVHDLVLQVGEAKFRVDGG